MHLRIFDIVSKGRLCAERNNDSIRFNPRLITPCFDQRAMLMTSMGAVTTYDGDTVSTHRSRTGEAYSQQNVFNTVMQLENEWKALNEGETFYVSQHIAATVAAAAELAEPEPLFPTDLIAPSGLIVLETPLILDDLHPDTGEVVEGLKMPVRAIAWQERKVAVTDDTADSGYKMVPGVHMTFYVDEDSFVTTYVTSYREHFPERTDEADSMLANADAMGIWASDITAWAYGEPWREGTIDPVNDEHVPGVIIGSHSFMRRWIPVAVPVLVAAHPVAGSAPPGEGREEAVHAEDQPRTDDQGAEVAAHRRSREARRNDRRSRS